MQLSKLTPDRHEPLPDYGLPIIKYVSERVLVEAQQLRQVFFNRNNRTTFRKLSALSQSGWLSRYNLTDDNGRVTGAYSIGETGLLLAPRHIPFITISKFQEILAANAFIFQNHIEDFYLQMDDNLTVGEVSLNGKRYALYCPIVVDSRLNALRIEVGLHLAGLIIVAPDARTAFALKRETQVFSFSTLFTTAYQPTRFI